MRTPTREEIEKVLSSILKDYKPFIEDIGGGWYRINGGDGINGRQVYGYTNKAGAAMAAKALEDEIKKNFTPEKD